MCVCVCVHAFMRLCVRVCVCACAFMHVCVSVYALYVYKICLFVCVICVCAFLQLYGKVNE